THYIRRHWHRYRHLVVYYRRHHYSTNLADPVTLYHLFIVFYRTWYRHLPTITCCPKPDGPLDDYRIKFNRMGNDRLSSFDWCDFSNHRLLLRWCDWNRHISKCATRRHDYPIFFTTF